MPVHFWRNPPPAKICMRVGPPFSILYFTLSLLWDILSSYEADIKYIYIYVYNSTNFFLFESGIVFVHIHLDLHLHKRFSFHIVISYVKVEFSPLAEREITLDPSKKRGRGEKEKKEEAKKKEPIESLFKCFFFFFQSLTKTKQRGIDLVQQNCSKS